MSFLIIDHVSYRYERDKTIVKDVTWEIERGKFYSLLGRSGCGKTTLLKIASGLLTPNEGTVYLDNQPVLKPSLDVGYVFQAPTLLEWKTVLDNVLLPITLKRKPTTEEHERALALLKVMKLEEYQSQFPNELSGGQQSRVAIARALIKNPSMLFMDEPFAALDAMTREELQDDLLALCKDHKMTVLFITHDIDEAVYLSDHVAVMRDGQIAFHLEVNLPEPRKVDSRYSPLFNEHCLNVRDEMTGGSR